MELLSPAGNFESLVAALNSGADAIYIGGTMFSARRNAKNFTDEEIKKGADLCHLHNAKLYVAVNILIKEKELEDATSYVKSLIELGVDGIIVQDLGLMSVIRKMSPEIFINASTQMTIASSDAANFAKSMGADRVVLARELGIKEIKSIKQNTEDVELETFVHGALCMSWSGQCLISSVIGGRSGNRGLCAQPCRLNYTLLKDGKAVSENLPLLSLKDICLADKLSDLDGVADSLKIEGRMKSPEYTAAVTALYKKAISGKITQEEIEKTLSFFSRGGSTLGYFNGRRFDKMMDYKTSEKISAEREDVVSLKQDNLANTRKISMKLQAKEGKAIELLACCDGFFATATGDILEKARKDFDSARAKEQLEKLGGTAFTPENIEIITQGNPFVPVSSLNALRREVCADLESQICKSYEKEVNDIKMPDKTYKRRTIPELLVEVSTKEQLYAARTFDDMEILTGYELSKEIDSEFVLCPAVKKEGEEEKITAKKIMVQNIGQIDSKKELYGGERLNVTNSVTCEVLRERGFRRVTLSPELNIREIKEISQNTDMPLEVIAYGKLPLMVMENCVIKSCGMCTQSGGVFELLDRMNERFPIVCENCRNILLNSVPIYLADKCDDLISLNVDVLRLKFTTEDADDLKTIISAYKEALAGKIPKGTIKKITRGHMYRGAE